MSRFPKHVDTGRVWAVEDNLRRRGTVPTFLALAFNLFCSVTFNKLLPISGLVTFHTHEVKDNYPSPRAFMSIKGGNG